MKGFYKAQSSRGFTLIEVLVTFLILAIGLLGLAGLQVTTLSNQLESYQRLQAILMLEDISNRIRVNSIQARAGNYTVDNDYGLQTIVNPCVGTTAARDLCEWNTMLAGTSVVSASAQNLGSIAGARGCIERIVGSSDGEAIIRVTIAWQGSSPTAAPASTCGLNQYGTDEHRRTASINVVLANLAL